MRKELTKENIQEISEEAANFIKRGYAVIVPTDTLYGLAVNALDEDAVSHFFALKKRPSNKPIPIFVKDIKMAKELAFINDRQEEILKKLWPGPFTFVLNKKQTISAKLSAKTEKIGLRMPNHLFVKTLMDELDKPITGSSANISGLAPSGDLDDIVSQFKEHSIVPDYIVDIGILESKDPSTVIDITSKEPKVLRMNPTTIKQMQEVFKKLG